MNNYNNSSGSLSNIRRARSARTRQLVGAQIAEVDSRENSAKIRSKRNSFNNNNNNNISVPAINAYNELEALLAEDDINIEDTFNNLIQKQNKKYEENTNTFNNNINNNKLISYYNKNNKKNNSNNSKEKEMKPTIKMDYEAEHIRNDLEQYMGKFQAEYGDIEQRLADEEAKKNSVKDHQWMRDRVAIEPMFEDVALQTNVDDNNNNFDVVSKAITTYDMEEAFKQMIEYDKILEKLDKQEENSNIDDTFLTSLPHSKSQTTNKSTSSNKKKKNKNKKHRSNKKKRNEKKTLEKEDDSINNDDNVLGFKTSLPLEKQRILIKLLTEEPEVLCLTENDQVKYFQATPYIPQPEDVEKLHDIDRQLMSFNDTNRDSMLSSTKLSQISRSVSTDSVANRALIIKESIDNAKIQPFSFWETESVMSSRPSSASTTISKASKRRQQKVQLKNSITSRGLDEVDAELNRLKRRSRSSKIAPKKSLENLLRDIRKSVKKAHKKQQLSGYIPMNDSHDNNDNLEDNNSIVPPPMPSFNLNSMLNEFDNRINMKIKEKSTNNETIEVNELVERLNDNSKKHPNNSDTDNDTDKSDDDNDDAYSEINNRIKEMRSVVRQHLTKVKRDFWRSVRLSDKKIENNG